MIKLLDIIEEREKIDIDNNNAIVSWLSGIGTGYNSLSKLKQYHTETTAIGKSLYRSIALNYRSFILQFPKWYNGIANYKSRKKYSSWSHSKKITHDFEFLGAEVNVIFETIINDPNKIIFDFTNKSIKGYSENPFANEKEVILQTDIPIDCKIIEVVFQSDIPTNWNILNEKIKIAKSNGIKATFSDLVVFKK